MAEKIRAGVIGASVNRGWGWRSHIPALQVLPEFELTAICTAHEETAREAAEATGARLAFSDYREMVANPEIDLISVAVRVPWHREMVLAAIEAGKHVYCEWPLGTNLQEVIEMADAARSAERRRDAGHAGTSGAVGAARQGADRIGLRGAAAERERAAADAEPVHARRDPVGGAAFERQPHPVDPGGAFARHPVELPRRHRGGVGAAGDVGRGVAGGGLD